MRRILLLLLAVTMISTSCQSGPSSSDAATSDETNAEEAASPGYQSEEATGIDDPATTGNGNEANGNEANGEDPVNDQPEVQEIAGVVPQESYGTVGLSDCDLDQFPRRGNYAVFNIEDDDPDGGLVMRKEQGDGQRLAVLPQDSVVVPSFDVCELVGDSGVWWLVFDVVSGQEGWVNAAWLTDNPGPQVPRYHQGETEEKVETLLDALAGENWTGALSVLIGQGVAADVEAQVGDLYGADAEANLAAYCDRYICDAPFEIVDSTGTITSIGFDDPTVSVRFSYPDGDVTEVFRGLVFEGLVDAVAPLPGRSALALRQPVTPIESLLSDESEEPSDPTLLEAAEQIRAGLISSSGPQIADEFIPDSWIVMSGRTTIEDGPYGPATVTAADLANGEAEYVFEYTEAGPIITSVDDWMSGYRQNSTLLDPDATSVNASLGFGNSINNLAERYPNADIVEFHREGRGELKDFNWATTRIVVEKIDGQWKLLAIMGDAWTI